MCWQGVGIVVVLILLLSVTGVKAQHPKWMLYTTENSKLPENQIRALALDAQGNLWIGTFLGGLAVYREEGIIFPK